MSKVQNLLNNISIDDITLYTVEPETEEHIIVGSDRFITVPDSLKRIAVQYDHNIETVTFDCPRYWDGIDMLKMKIYINYKRPDNNVGMYLVTNVKVNPNDSSRMTFNWTISRNVTEVSGKLTFLICIKKIDKDGFEINHWNSEVNTDMYVSGGLECKNPIVEKYPDVISYILTKIDSISGETNAGKIIAMIYGPDNASIAGLAEI